MQMFCPHCDDYTEIISVNGADVCTVCKNILRSEYLPKGTIISGFRIEEEIGRGAMGTVYKARQINLNRYVALKVLSKELSEDFEFVERFFSEARSVGALSHPNIVQAYDAGATPEGIYYLAMELIEGETLETRIKREGSIEEKLGIDIAIKIASALKYAWDTRKICHGDIKPENIILNSSGDVKLADLGLAMSVLEDNTGRELMGTPLYAPPEIITGELKKIGDKSDMYSFGATLYHMFTGLPPFPGDDSEEVMRQHLTKKAEPINKRHKNLNPKLVDLTDKLLEKNPQNRPSDWKKVIDILKQCKGVPAPKKVFHKSSGKSGHIRHDKFSQSSVKHVPKETKKGVPRVLIITGSLFILLITIFLLFGKRHFYKGRHSTEFDIARKNIELQKELDSLKVQVKYAKSPELAIQKVKSFMQKWGDKCPKDVQKLLNGLKLRIIKQEKQEKIRQIISEKFLNEINVLSKYLGGKNLSGLSDSDLKQLNSRIERIFKLHSKHPFLSGKLSDVNYKFLTDKYMKISFILSKRREKYKKERLANEKKKAILLAKKEELRNLRKRNKLIKSERQKQLLNNAYDAYYLVIVDFLTLPWKERTPSVFLKLLSDWKKKNKLIPEKIRKRVALAEKYLPDLLPIKQLLIKHAKTLLIGKRLSERLAPSEFIIDSVTEKSIKLFPEHKVKIGKIVHWDELEQNDIYKIIVAKSSSKKDKLTPRKLSDYENLKNKRTQYKRRRLKFGGRLKKLTAKEQISLIFFLISIKKYQTAEELINYCKGIEEEEKELWKQIINDFRSIKEKYASLLLWRKIKNFSALEKAGAEQRGNFSVPKGFFESEIYGRHKREIDTFLQSRLLLSPVTQLKRCIALWQSQINNKKYIRAFYTILTTYARYGQNQYIPLEMRQSLITAKNKSLRFVINMFRPDTASDIKNDNEEEKYTGQKISKQNKIKFKFLISNPKACFEWGRLSPLFFYLLEEHFKRKPVFSDKILNSALSLYTSLNYANWVKCKDIYQFSRAQIFVRSSGSESVDMHKPETAQIFADTIYKKIGERYGSTLAYTYGFLAWRYGDTVLIRQAKDILRKQIRPNEKISETSSLVWLFRYLILIRDANEIKKIIKTRSYKQVGSKAWLVYILSILQPPFPDIAAFRKAMTQYSLNNENSPDAALLNLTYYMLKNNVLPDLYKISEIIDTTENRVNPITIEIFLDALFSSKISSPLPKEYTDYILDVVPKFISASPLYGSRLWKQAAILRIAQATCREDLINKIGEVLNDISPASTPYYPTIITILTSLISSKEKKGDLSSDINFSDIKNVYKKLLGEISMASEVELNAFDLLEDGDIDVIVQDLFSSHQYENAFNEIMIGLLCDKYDKRTKQIEDMKKSIDINKDKLEPSERYLINVLKRGMENER